MRRNAFIYSGMINFLSIEYCRVYGCETFGLRFELRQDSPACVCGSRLPFPSGNQPSRVEGQGTPPSCAIAHTHSAPSTAKQPASCFSFVRDIQKFIHGLRSSCIALFRGLLLLHLTLCVLAGRTGSVAARRGRDVSGDCEGSSNVREQFLQSVHRLVS